ncbi:hypothetical protein Tco_0341177 [Tanacetum coccineum]
MHGIPSTIICYRDLLEIHIMGLRSLQKALGYTRLRYEYRHIIRRTMTDKAERTHSKLSKICLEAFDPRLPWNNTVRVWVKHLHSKLRDSISSLGVSCGIYPDVSGADYELMALCGGTTISAHEREPYHRDLEQVVEGRSAWRECISRTVRAGSRGQFFSLVRANVSDHACEGMEASAGVLRLLMPSHVVVLDAHDLLLYRPDAFFTFAAELRSRGVDVGMSTGYDMTFVGGDSWYEYSWFGLAEPRRIPTKNLGQAE